MPSLLHSSLPRLLLPVLSVLLAGCATTIQPSAHGGWSSEWSSHAPAYEKTAPPLVLGTKQADQDIPLQELHKTPAPPLLDLTAPSEDVWERIRKGFAMPDLHSPLVAERQSWYLNRPEALRRVFARGGRYLYHIVDELEKRGLPTELALLPMVESAFNPLAVSHARAMGLWQFIPSTGKSHDLTQNWWVDERRDILASTDAALRYLENIYKMHGDWHLTLASYNWGKNAVARAIARNAAQGLPTDYSSLTMPDETRHYVPKLQALKNIVAQPEVYGFRLPPIPNTPFFETVVKPDRIDIAVAARLAEMPIEEFISLNPAYHRPVMKEEHAGPLLLPSDRVETFLENLARHAAQDKPLSNWLTYRMRRGDTLAKIAARHKISERRLREINSIRPRMRVTPGFTLLVPRPGSQVDADKLSRVLPREGGAVATQRATSSRNRPAARNTASQRRNAATQSRPRKQAQRQ